MKRLCYKCRQPLKETVAWEGVHPDCFCSWFDLTRPEEFQDVVAQTDRAASNKWTAITSSFFHGKFRKYSARLGNKSYLLKVQQSELPELPAMEYLCNLIAKDFGLKVPHFYFIRFQNQLDTFVSENFMQNYSKSNLVHIYRFLDKPEQFTCEGLYQIISREVKHLDDLQRFITLSLFDALIGNHDRHGRNLGLIQTGKTSLLAPFYDNPSYLAIEDPLLLGAFHEPRGAIATKATSEPTLRDYVKEWFRMGHKEEVVAFKAKVDIHAIHRLIEESFISEKRKRAFSRLIERRYQELCRELENAP